MLICQNKSFKSNVKGISNEMVKYVFFEKSEEFYFLELKSIKSDFICAKHGFKASSSLLVDDITVHLVVYHKKIDLHHAFNEKQMSLFPQEKQYKSWEESAVEMMRLFLPKISKIIKFKAMEGI